MLVFFWFFSTHSHDISHHLIAADWEARGKSLDSRMHSQMKKEVDLEAIHPLETHIQSSRSPMESSQTTKSEMDPRRPSQQMDSSHSASPVGAASVVTTPPRNIISSVQEVGRGHALQDDRSLANSGESFLPFKL